MKDHWTATAERVSDGDWRILGEDDHGDLFVPIGDGQWKGIYKPWKPTR